MEIIKQVSDNIQQLKESLREKIYLCITEQDYKKIAENSKIIKKENKKDLIGT